MRFTAVAAVAALFAGQTLAQNMKPIQFTTGNLTASQIFNQTDIDSLSCDTACSPAQSAITACTDTNAACLCAPATTGPIVTCEQCMFTAVINKNIFAPSPLAGSSGLLTAYATACNATLDQGVPVLAIAPPPGFLGTFEFVFSTPVDAIVVAIGSLIGLSSLLLLANIS